MSHLTDNKGVVSILHKGSPVEDLQDLALQIHKLCWIHDIRLRIHWTPRSDPRLQAADARSRHFDHEDWGVGRHGFLEEEEFASEPMQIDLFATNANKKCSLFASKFVAELPLAVGVNAFSLNWSAHGFFFACPPPRLIIPTLTQTGKQRAKGILLVPRWPSAGFWPYLLPDGRHFIRLVSKFKTFRPYCVSGPDIRNTTFKGDLNFDLLVLELNGNQQNPFILYKVKTSCLSNGCFECANK